LWAVYGTLLGLTYPILNTSARSQHDTRGGTQALSDHPA
jgi:hypothetical protein